MRPVAGQNQAGCSPATGSCRVASRSDGCPMIPSGWPGGNGSDWAVPAGGAWLAEAAARGGRGWAGP